MKDPLKFYQAVGTTEGANSRLSPLLNAAVRRVLGDATLIQVVRDQREELMARVRQQIEAEALNFGVEIVDVRIRRADLPSQNSEAVYKRMQTDREREAQEFRSLGTQKSQEIRAKADREATVIVAEATSKAEQVRGEGDAERNRIFAEAYSKDPDFFAFYRSMQAYETGLQRAIRGWCWPDSDSSATSPIRRAGSPRPRAHPMPRHQSPAPSAPAPNAPAAAH